MLNRDASQCLRQHSDPTPRLLQPNTTVKYIYIYTHTHTHSYALKNVSPTYSAYSYTYLLHSTAPTRCCGMHFECTTVLSSGHKGRSCLLALGTCEACGRKKRKKKKKKRKTNPHVVTAADTLKRKRRRNTQKRVSLSIYKKKSVTGLFSIEFVGRRWLQSVGALALQRTRM